MSIHHLQLWVPDLARAEESWGWLLGQLGYDLARTWDHGRVWRQDGTGIVIEASPDMVPGMLHSRLRPGMNHGRGGNGDWDRDGVPNRFDRAPGNPYYR